MCGLFGFSDLQHSLTEKQASALANSLARASAVRGQDATGIAYVQSGKLRIYKRPKPAARMQLRLPQRHDPTAGPCADDDPGEREEKL